MRGVYILTGSNDSFIYNRKRAEISGVCDVVEFSEDLLVLSCADGNISIDGSYMKIERFDSESGKLTVVGTIDGFIFYSDAQNGKKSKRFQG